VDGEGATPELLRLKLTVSRLEILTFYILLYIFSIFLLFFLFFIFFFSFFSFGETMTEQLLKYQQEEWMLKE
jgi:hypothetical protein